MLTFNFPFDWYTVTVYVYGVCCGFLCLCVGVCVWVQVCPCVHLCGDHRKVLQVFCSVTLLHLIPLGQDLLLDLELDLQSASPRDATASSPSQP